MHFKQKFLVQYRYMLYWAHDLNIWAQLQVDSLPSFLYFYSLHIYMFETLNAPGAITHSYIAPLFYYFSLNIHFHHQQNDHFYCTNTKRINLFRKRSQVLNQTGNQHWSAAIKFLEYSAFDIWYPYTIYMCHNSKFTISLLCWPLSLYVFIIFIICVTILCLRTFWEFNFSDWRYNIEFNG